MKAEFRRGHRAEVATEALLKARGLNTVLTPQKIRPTFEERRKYKDPGYDLIVEGRRVEVRHRAGYVFTGPHDFPREGVWFDNGERWFEEGRVRPRAYACVSGASPDHLTGFLAIIDEDYDQIYVDYLPDSTRFQDDGSPAIREAILIHQRYALTLDQFVDWAKGQLVRAPRPVISFTDGWEPEELDPADLDLLLDAAFKQEQRERRDQNRRDSRAAKRREQLALRAIEDQAKRAWIEAGNELRQPPEYRGRVWDVPDRDGVHPTAFPPLREGAGAELSEEFIAFQVWNQTRAETHPGYYCVDCKIRYNARVEGRCGPCLSKLQETTRSSGLRPATVPYPL